MITLANSSLTCTHLNYFKAKLEIVHYFRITFIAANSFTLKFKLLVLNDPYILNILNKPQFLFLFHPPPISLLSITLFHKY